MKNRLQPKNRSSLRIKSGKIYFIWQRYLKWYFTTKRYAKLKNNESFKFMVYQHKTPIYRKLKSVDMWYQENKKINLQIALKKLNNIIINPGEIFSYWKLIGRPTKRKGYVDGMVLFYGKFKAGVGGGLCQLSNLLYWITLHTPLIVTERYRHSYDVFPDSKRSQPFGSGATCVYNYRDLQILNNSRYPFQLRLKIENDLLKGEWRTAGKPEYKYKIYEKEHNITHESWGGYVRHNLIWRKVFDLDDKLADDQYITENHALMMYQPFLEDQANQ